jgi:hypothetical protein
LPPDFERLHQWLQVEGWDALQDAWICGEMLTSILGVVGEAKLADDATRLLPSSAAPMAITGPRPGEVVKGNVRPDMDDDIPF